MELVAHLRLSKQALIDLAFFCGVPIVLATLSAVLGPYAAVMGGAGATIYVLSLAIVLWCLTGHPIGEQKRRAKTAALADCGHRCHRLVPVRVAVCICRQFDRGGHMARSGRSARNILSPPPCPRGGPSFSGSPSLSFSMRRRAG